MCVQFISWNVLATVLNANWIVTAAHCVNEYIFFIEKTRIYSFHIERIQNIYWRSLASMIDIV